MNKKRSLMLTAAVILVGVAALAFKYWAYVTNPWTRNGMVRANVVQITPRVSGQIVELPIKDNQLVKAGDLLFEIDRRTFVAERDRTAAGLARTRDEIKALEKQVKAAKASLKQFESRITQVEIAIKARLANVTEARATYERTEKMVPEGAASLQRLDDTRAAFDVARARVEEAEQRMVEAMAAKIQAQADLAKAEADLGVSGEQNARLQEAKAIKETAELDLEFTRVTAPVDGYVTNLNLRTGDQAVTDKPVLALVDVNSFWIHGYFRETVIGKIRPGDRAIVTLMSYPHTPLEGHVDSIGRGIAQEDGSTGFQLLPNIRPTFEWIRLAQRVPVRIHLANVPENVELIVGTTASVLVMTGTAETEGGKPMAAAPRALQ